MATSNLYDKLLRHFGGQSNAARALGVRPAVVCNWAARGLPHKRALEIEAATKGVISARDILMERERNQ